MNNRGGGELRRVDADRDKVRIDDIYRRRRQAAKRAARARARVLVCCTSGEQKQLPFASERAKYWR